MTATAAPCPSSPYNPGHQDPRNFMAAATAYDRAMGRYLTTLGPAFADAVGVGPSMRLLDVGCGPGSLTRELVARVGADSVVAIDPSPPFVAACRERLPGVDVREGVAEQLPFADASFDGAVASLVVGFMQDAATGVREMARVTRPGGFVAACAWDHTGMPAFRAYWQAAATVDPARPAQTRWLGSSRGEIAGLLTQAGLSDVREGTITGTTEYENFNDLWDPIALGVGPTGRYLQSLDQDRREQLRLACHALLGSPNGSFSLEGTAWFARGVV